ncbi:MAG: MFS transporter [Gemmatimonadota bacterium]
MAAPPPPPGSGRRFLRGPPDDPDDRSVEYADWDDHPAPRPPEPDTGLHRNVWVASVTSFLTDVSSEMLQNVLPLFLANVLGVRTWAVGVVEGLAESTASLLKLWSGWLSDRLGARKWLAVSGYGISASSKPFYLVAASWPVVAAIRWADRVGKGVRTAPRDALLADSVNRSRRGLAFGIHRASDTAGAVVGIAASLAIVHAAQGGALLLEHGTFHHLVLWSLLPAFLAVLTLAMGAKDVPVKGGERRGPKVTLRGMSRSFRGFVLASAIFQIGNSSDAFLILRAQERGLGVLGLLWMLLLFNVVYTAVSAPAGSLADRVPRKWVVLGAWCVYALVYLGFALARTTTHVVVLFAVYGVYMGAVAGASKALVADLVEPERRGTAYGTYHAVIGLMSLPASLLAGLLWQGFAGWAGLGPAAPFAFGAAAAGVASLVLLATVPSRGSA